MSLQGNQIPNFYQSFQIPEAPALYDFHHSRYDSRDLGREEFRVPNQMMQNESNSLKNSLGSWQKEIPFNSSIQKQGIQPVTTGLISHQRKPSIQSSRPYKAPTNTFEDRAIDSLEV